MKRCTKTCPKTMSGKHYFPDRVWSVLGEKVVNGRMTYICGYPHVACKYCGLIDDRPKKKEKK